MSTFALFKPFRVRALTLACGMAMTGSAIAGGPVTTITTSIQTVDPSSYTATDLNQNSHEYKWGQSGNTNIESFNYGVDTLVYQAVASKVVFRRSDNGIATGAGQCTLFAETIGTLRSYKASFPADATDPTTCDMAAVMSGRTINRGVLDVFANVGSTAKNIERVDFLFDDAVSVASDLDKAGFLVIEKQGNNAVQVAAVTSVDSLGNPTGYSNVIVVDDSGGDIAYGSVASTSADHDFLTNTLTGGGYPVRYSGFVEDLGAAFVSLQDFNVAANTPVYGFSYFASDVDASGSLIDYNAFPKNTGTTANNLEDEADLFGGASGFFVATSMADFDKDGINDDVDLDDDNDGIIDADEGTGDLDNDGMPNRLDLDSDGDGINDLEESGLDEARQASLDTNGDGEIDGSNSFGSNGLANDLEPAVDVGFADYDGNGTGDDPSDDDADYALDTASNQSRPNFLDHDSDSDGITDAIEAGFEDANSDGIADGIAGVDYNRTNNPINSDRTFNLPGIDGDMHEDYRDVDSDDDGIPDVVEAGGTDADHSARHDAINSAPAFPAPSKDGLEDIDLDGLDDGLETNPLPVPDTDGDGLEDFRDLDSDNDGIPDLIEAGGADTDVDGQVDDQVDTVPVDGMHDMLCMVCGIPNASPLPTPDTDEDGRPDYQDTDSDDDGIPDVDEAGLGDNDTNNNGVIDGSEFTDANGDGWDDDAKDDITDVLGDDGTLPDEDDNGIPDVLEGNDCNCDSDEKFRTGLDGHGGGSFDLLLLSLLGGGLLTRRVGRKAGIAAALLAFAPMQSQAENSPSDREMDTRLYIGAGLGITNVDPEAVCPCYGVDDDMSAGGEIFVGMDITRRFSIEGYYADLGKAKIHGLNGADAGEIGYQHYGISALGYLYNSRDSYDYEKGYDDEGLFRREGLSLYGRVGAGVMSNDSDVDYERVNDAHMHLGAGAEYGWENGVAARAEFTSYDTDAKMLSLAVLKRLGDVTEYTGEKVEMKQMAAAPRQQFTLGDADGDGEPDGMDVCPMTPPGVAVNELGCNIDRDGDGVINSKDQCQGTHAGIEVDATGCPRKKMMMSPVMASPAIADQFQGVLEGVWFDHDSDRLTTEAKQILNEAASALKQHPSVKLVVVGHTCAGGNPVHNKDLSTRRARKVARYLASNGVRGSRLRYTGKGATMPLVSNSTPEGMARNRRVEFVTRGFQ